MASIDDYAVADPPRVTTGGLAIALGLRNPEAERDELGEWADVQQVLVAPGDDVPEAVAAALEAVARERVVPVEG